MLREMRGSAHLLALAAVGFDTGTANAIGRPHTTSTIGWAEPFTINVADLRLWQEAEDLTDAIVEPAYDTLTPDEASALVVGTAALQAALALPS